MKKISFQAWLMRFTILTALAYFGLLCQRPLARMGTVVLYSIVPGTVLRLNGILMHVAVALRFAYRGEPSPRTQKRLRFRR
jgi:hypothetical protein